MKTKAAVIRGLGQEWEITELDLDPPKAGEVLIRFVAAGLCHSDDHLRTGDIPVRYPLVGGHEGAGIIEEVGAGSSRFKPGDHVVCSFLPVCGHCRFCARGLSNLCDLGALLVKNYLPDHTYRFRGGGEDFGQMCVLGTFSQWAVVSKYSCVKVDDDLPLETVALVGCGVCTGWGTAVHAGEVRADALREADRRRAVRQRKSLRGHPPHARAVPRRPAEARRTGDDPLPAGRRQPGLPRPPRWQEYPGSYRPRALTGYRQDQLDFLTRYLRH
jgi:NADPH:quinone reductase-like Zn-dependent oxidoreductase